MRDSSELIPRRSYPLVTDSEFPMLEEALRRFQVAYDLPARMSLIGLFTLAFSVGYRMGSYPEMSIKWGKKNFTLYVQQGWIPDFLYRAMRVSQTEVTSHFEKLKQKKKR